MKSKLQWLLTGMLCALGWITAPADPAAQKTVMVYYMPWFSAKPFSRTWGWHWTMDHFNPDVTNAVGQREIASWYYPAIGPYDSADPAVLEYHVLLMKLAGIDGVIVDWYGSASYMDYSSNNQATLKLFDFTRKAGLKFGICYEDQTIQHLIDGHYLAASKALSQAQFEMLYLQTNYFADPSYLRQAGRPVLLNFGPQYFLTSSNWEAIFSVLAATNQPAFFNEDNRLPAGQGAFDWPPMWMSQAPGTGGVLSDAALQSYLAGFDQKAAAWPAYISSAFPRFHDIYQRAGQRSYFGYLGDQHGEVLRGTLSRSLTNSSAMVLVVTWNDFGEGSMVEPTEQYGCRDLEIIQQARRHYLQPDFPAIPGDLGMAMRFYRLRRELAANPELSQKLDLVFTNIVTGRINDANQQLQELESNAGQF